MNARHVRASLTVAVAGACLATTAYALPPTHADAAALVRAGEPVTSIPTADSVTDFQPLDDEHVVLSTRDKHYLVTLNKFCVGLRWARRVGVTASRNTIYVGFDAVTADAEACPIQAIHLLPEPHKDAL